MMLPAGAHPACGSSATRGTQCRRALDRPLHRVPTLAPRPLQAAMLGWDRLAASSRTLGRSLSGASLASAASSGTPPSTPGAPTGVRGSMRDTGSTFPLVLDWTASGDSEALGSSSGSSGSGGASARQQTMPEDAMGRAIAEHQAARGAAGGSGGTAPADGGGAG